MIYIAKQPKPWSIVIPFYSYKSLERRIQAEMKAKIKCGSIFTTSCQKSMQGTHVVTFFCPESVEARFPSSPSRLGGSPGSQRCQTSEILKIMEFEEKKRDSFTLTSPH